MSCGSAGSPRSIRRWRKNAAEKRTSFTDFLEELLVAERESRRARAREMLARVAGFPAIKTLDQYDFNFATGASRKPIIELASLAFVERAENVVFLGPPGVGKTHPAIALVISPPRRITRRASSVRPIWC
jgi:DNA replication protein DnaC